MDETKQHKATAARTVRQFTKPLLQPVMALTRRMTAGTIDYAQPVTEIARIDRDFERHTTGPDAVSAEDLAKGLAALAEDPEFRQFVDERVPNFSTPIVSYFRNLEQRFPMATLPILGAQKLATRETFSEYLRVIGLLETATKQRREKRCEALRQVALVAIESLYFKLVDAVYVAECLLQNRHIDVKATSGTKLRLVTQWTASSLPQFFDPDANHFRNAAAHRRWHYLYKSNEVELFDPPKWKQQVPNRELFQRLGKIAVTSVSLWEIQLAVASPAVISMFQDAGVVRVLRDPDNEKLDETVLKARMDPALASLAAIGWQDPEATQSSPTGPAS